MMKRKMKENKANLLAILLVFTFFIFFIFVVGTPNLNFNKSRDQIGIINSDIVTDVLLLTMGEEVPQFKGFLEREMEIPPISKVIFEAITGVKTNNLSTLLLHEIPGFNSVTTKIYIAGEGSDYSNLPVESPPPDFDKLLEGVDSEKEYARDSEDSHNEESSLDEIKDPSVFIYHSHSWEGYLPGMSTLNCTYFLRKVIDSMNVIFKFLVPDLQIFLCT